VVSAAPESRAIPRRAKSNPYEKAGGKLFAVPWGHAVRLELNYPYVIALTRTSCD
jgi:hypothetical protein